MPFLLLPLVLLLDSTKYWSFPFCINSLNFHKRPVKILDQINMPSAEWIAWYPRCRLKTLLLKATLFGFARRGSFRRNMLKGANIWARCGPPWRTPPWPQRRPSWQMPRRDKTKSLGPFCWSLLHWIAVRNQCCIYESTHNLFMYIYIFMYKCISTYMYDIW